VAGLISNAGRAPIVGSVPAAQPSSPTPGVIDFHSLK
jgi:hypothetical protein